MFVTGEKSRADLPGQRKLVLTLPSARMRPVERPENLITMPVPFDPAVPIAFHPNYFLYLGKLFK
jgi:hypothetical protein